MFSFSVFIWKIRFWQIIENWKFAFGVLSEKDFFKKILLLVLKRNITNIFILSTIFNLFQVQIITKLFNSNKLLIFIDLKPYVSVQMSLGSTLRGAVLVAARFNGPACHWRLYHRLCLIHWGLGFKSVCVWTPVVSWSDCHYP